MDDSFPTSDSEETMEVSVSSLSSLKKGQRRSVLQFQDDEPAQQDPGASAHIIATDMEVDHAGTAIYLRGQSVVDTAFPPLILIHELGASSFLYRQSSKSLVEQGFSTYTFDLRGHGRSGKRLGHVASIDSLIKDLLQVAAWVKHREDGRAPIIVAHGLGAVLAMHFQQKQYKFCQGLVLAAPTIKLKQPLSRFATFLVSLFADIHPAMKLPGGITPRFLYQLRGYQQSQNTSQPVVLSRISAQFCKEILQALEAAPTQFLRIKVPTLVIQTQHDEISDFSMINDLLARHKFQDLIKIESSPSNHRVLTDGDESLEQTLSTVAHWIRESFDRRTKQAPE